MRQKRSKALSLSNLSSSALKSIGVDNNELIRKNRRIAQVKEIWKFVASPYILKHTNNVIIINDKKSGKKLIVYVDNSLVATEINARRELIRLKILQEFNEVINSFEIHVSYGRYKNNYIFQDEEVKPYEDYKKEVISKDAAIRIESKINELENIELKKAINRAFNENRG